jgi:dihydroorotate dehydrogenase
MFSLPARALALSYPMLRPWLFGLDAEEAHHISVKALRVSGRFLLTRNSVPHCAPVELWGLKFPNRVGLAAGLDKAGECVDGFGAMGFGFVEIGTLTPRPQPGNPKPRLFRIISREAIINRFGFNNPGIVQGVANASARRYQGILGINIGKNFDTPNERATEDYLKGLRGAWQAADYIAVNLSSPNTKGLRDLQHAEACRSLIRALHAEKSSLEQQHQKSVPILIKIAPDLENQALEDLAKLFCEEKLAGVIATNTTLSRDGVAGEKYAGEAGGLSGAPLTKRSTEMLARLVALLDGQMPVIGVGGIMNGADALEKLQTGVALLQLYSGFVYAGPALAQDCIQAAGEYFANQVKP